MRTFSDSDFVESGPRTFNDSDFSNSPNNVDSVPSNPNYEVSNQSRTAVNFPSEIKDLGNNTAGPFVEGLLTNKPTRGISGLVGRALPASIGGLIAGPAGAAALEASRQSAASLVATQRNEEPPTVLDAVGRPIMAAGAQYVGEKTGEAFNFMLGRGNGLKAAVLRSANAIPEKYGKAALENPGAMLGAKSAQDVSDSYSAFQRYTGLRSLGEQIVDRGESFTPKELERIVIGTSKKIAAGENVAPQDLYTASQAASKLKQFAKYGDPEAKSVVEAGIISQGKQLADDALQVHYPEYENLRGDAFWSKVSGQFDSAAPLNKNQSVNQLRSWGNLQTAAIGAATGHPEFLLAPVVASPAVAKLGIAAGYAASKALPELGKAAGQVLAQQAMSLMSGSSLAAFYNSPRTAP